MDHEMETFQKDLLASVRQMKAGKAARTTEVTLSAAYVAGLGARTSATCWCGTDPVTSCKPAPRGTARPSGRLTSGRLPING